MERNINRVDVSFTFNQQHLDLTNNRIIFLLFFSMTSHIHFCRSNHSFTPSGEFASKTLLPTSEFTKPSMNTTPLEEKHPQPLLCSLVGILLRNFFHTNALPSRASTSRLGPCANKTVLQKLPSFCARSFAKR